MSELKYFNTRELVKESKCLNLNNRIIINIVISIKDRVIGKLNSSKPMTKDTKKKKIKPF